MSLTPAAARSERLIFLDALRGIACLMVFVFHLFEVGALHPVLVRQLPPLFNALVHLGSYGLQIFFVLSGFVIAHSLRATPMNARSIGRFVVRRQLRLDPPYWAMMLICLLLWWIESKLVGPPYFSYVSWRAWLVNAVYLHNILGVRHVLGVAWTLCLEIQFYLFFIMLLALATGRNQATAPTRVGLALLWVSGVASICVGNLIAPATYFPGYWYMFAGGVLACWALRTGAARRAFLSYIIALSLYAGWVWFDQQWRFDGALPTIVLAIATILTIWGVGERGELKTRSISPIIQYFGTISYSLYLMHMPIMILIFRVGFQITGESLAGAAAWLLLSALLSIGGAQLLFLCVERPSMNWASRFKRKSIT